MSVGQLTFLVTAGGALLFVVAVISVLHMLAERDQRRTLETFLAKQRKGEKLADE